MAEGVGMVGRVAVRVAVRVVVRLLGQDLGDLSNSNFETISLTDLDLGRAGSHVGDLLHRPGREGGDCAAP